MELQQPTGLEIQTRLIGRAATDTNFRQQLLANGRATIEKELGIELPADLEIQVIEETPSRLCLVLPMKQERQLSDAELSGVAGGIDTVPLPDMPVAELPVPIPMPVYSYSRLSIYRRR